MKFVIYLFLYIPSRINPKKIENLRHAVVIKFRKTYFTTSCKWKENQRKLNKAAACLKKMSTYKYYYFFRCGCEECRTSRQDDSLRHSRSRINAYRALASPSLIALSSKDPILTAFELSWELRRLSFAEHEFKSEYLVRYFNFLQSSFFNFSAQTSRSIFAQKYLCKCKATYLILQNKYLYEDWFGAKILRDNCALSQKVF